MVPARRQLVRHARTLADADVVEHDGLRVTSGAQTFLDLAATRHRPISSLSATPCAAVGIWTPPG